MNPKWTERTEEEGNTNAWETVVYSVGDINTKRAD